MYAHTHTVEMHTGGAESVSKVTNAHPYEGFTVPELLSPRFICTTQDPSSSKIKLCTSALRPPGPLAPIQGSCVCV